MSEVTALSLGIDEISVRDPSWSECRSHPTTIPMAQYIIWLTSPYLISISNLRLQGQGKIDSELL